MSYTLAATRLNEAMVLRAIKSGKVARRTASGGGLEPAHIVHRVFTLADATPGSAASKPEVFETQLAGLKPVAELLRGQLEDMRRDCDAWRDQVDGLPWPSSGLRGALSTMAYGDSQTQCLLANSARGPLHRF
jgi:hypothetical protein